MGIKSTLFLLLFVTLLIVVTDQTSNLFKTTFQRLRPCNNPDINTIIRIVKSSDTYSFFSGHAANSMATMTLVFLILKRHFRFAFLLFLFPLIFAYSRIYLGLHYPLDILTGYLFGACFGFIAYKLYQKYVLKDSRNG
jgi:undecaprenyl-diphosphatase